MSNFGKRKLPKPASKRLKKSVASTTVANLVNNQDFVELLNLFDQNKVRYLTAFSAALVEQYGESRFWFIDLPNLLLNKRATGRPEDLADVAKLQK